VVTEVDGRRIARVRVTAGPLDQQADTAQSLAEDAVASPLLTEDMASERQAEPDQRPPLDEHSPAAPPPSRPHGSTRIG